jgi:hypothetical protein
MKPEARITAAPVQATLDHALIIAVIGLVAETNRIDGKELAHVVTEVCSGIPEGTMGETDVANIVRGVIAIRDIERQAGLPPGSLG